MKPCLMKGITNWHKHGNPDFDQSQLLGIEGPKVGTQSPDFERDLYDLGQDHGGTRRAA